MIARVLLNVIWCEYWDDEINEAGGVMHVLGTCAPGEFPAVRAQARREAAQKGWGAGDAYATDEHGARITFHPEVPNGRWVGLN